MEVRGDTPVVAAGDLRGGSGKDLARQEVVKAVRALEKAEQFPEGQSPLGFRNEIAYSFDREARRTVVRILDRETGELIQQIPSEEILRRAARLPGR
jgi:hypothetical protein